MTTSYNESVNEQAKELCNQMILQLANGIYTPNQCIGFLDGKAGYTSELFTQHSQYKRHQVFVPNCGDDYDTLSKLQRRCTILPISMNNFLRQYAIKCFCLLWGDYCSTLQGNMSNGSPIDDIELMFKNQQMLPGCYYAITLSNRARTFARLRQQVHDVVTFYAAKYDQIDAEIFYEMSYGPDNKEHGMLFMVWKMKKLNKKTVTITEADIDFIRNDNPFVASGKRKHNISDNIERGRRRTVKHYRRKFADNYEGKQIYRRCEQVDVHMGPFYIGSRVLAIPNDERGKLYEATILKEDYEGESKNEWENVWFLVKYKTYKYDTEEDYDVEEEWLQQRNLFKICTESLALQEHRNTFDCL